MHLVRSSAARGFGAFAGISVLIVGIAAQGAIAVEPSVDSASDIARAVTGGEPELMESEVELGGFLTVSPAVETERTLVVEGARSTSIVASIEDESVDAVTFDLDLEDGFSISLDEDGTGYIFDDAQVRELLEGTTGERTGTIDIGSAVEATIAQPWAVDAAGNELETWYELDGESLVQHVDTDGAVFPVAADPSVGFGHQGVIPVVYLHLSRAETVDVSYYDVSSVATLGGWICDWLPGPAVSPCRSIVSSQAQDYHDTAVRARKKSNWCMSGYQGYPGIATLAQDFYTRVC